MVDNERKASDQTRAIFVTKTGENAAFEGLFVMQRRGLEMYPSQCLQFSIAIKEFMVEPRTHSLRWSGGRENEKNKE